MPRYAALFVLMIGVTYVLARSDTSMVSHIPLEVGDLVWVWPEWNLGALLGIGIPLYIVTMTSQNIPGVAVMQCSGYENTGVVFDQLDRFYINCVSAFGWFCT